MKQPADETRLHLSDFLIISALTVFLTGTLALRFAPDPAAQLGDWLGELGDLGARAADGAHSVLLLALALLAAWLQ